MPIEMPKGLPFSVDTWSPSSKGKRYHFLTHAHKDHCVGISHHSSFPIYCTHITKTILLHRFPQLDDSLFVKIEVGQLVVINDPDGTFSVSAFDANHCPGSVMFLFEGNFGNILHTGDCRLTPDCLQNLPMKYMSKKGRETKNCLDFLFLDCTFASCSLTLPSNHSAIQQVINCILEHPNAPIVYLACDLLGQEEILVEVSRTFGSKIYVDETKNAKCFQALTLIAPHILSPDASSRFQIIEGFPKLYERAEAKFKEAQSNLQLEPLFIRPSTQWYACKESSESEKQSKMRLKGAERDQFGVWHVCYSMHSSKGELEGALQLLRPKRVISTTPPCGPMELYYVRNHCFSMIHPCEIFERRSLGTSFLLRVENDLWLSAEERTCNREKFLLQGPNENDIVVAVKEKDGILWRMSLQKPEDVHQPETILLCGPSDKDLVLATRDKDGSGLWKMELINPIDPKDSSSSSLPIPLHVNQEVPGSNVQDKEWIPVQKKKSKGVRAKSRDS